jgi:hypothetical protein
MKRRGRGGNADKAREEEWIEHRREWHKMRGTKKGVWEITVWIKGRMGLWECRMFKNKQTNIIWQFGFPGFT